MVKQGLLPPPGRKGHRGCAERGYVEKRSWRTFVVPFTKTNCALSDELTLRPFLGSYTNFIEQISESNHMKKMQTTAKSIDEYIDDFPPDVQKTLQKVRKTIKKAAPNAEEAIKYGIPTFVLNGNLVHFGGYQEHIGFYPDPRGIKEFEKELSIYRAGKGTIRFPLDKPIPYELITRIVKFRVEQALEKAKTKGKKK